MSRKLTLASLVSVTLLLACSDASGPGEEKPSTDSVSAAAQVGLPRVRFGKKPPSQTEIAERLAGLSRALGVPAQVNRVLLLETRVGPGADPVERVDVAIDDSATVFGRYESLDDSFEVYEAESPVTPPSGKDIDHAGARKVLGATLANLEREGIVAPGRLDPKSTVVRTIGAAEGDQDGLKRSWIDEYAFFVPTKVAGIPVGTASREYGVWINVHRTGKVRRIEVLGSAIAADVAGAVAVGAGASRSVSTPDVRAAVEPELGNVDIEKIGLRLIVDERGTDGEVVPRELFRIVPITKTADGETIRSKAFVASYPVVGDSAKVELTPKPGEHGPEPIIPKPQP